MRSLVLLIAAPLLAFVESRCGATEPVQSPITVSRQTTHLLGPIDDHGYVKYAKALDRIYSRNVTPENNAAGLIWQATGPEALPRRVLEQHLDEFLDRLEIESLPKDGHYLIDTFRFFQERYLGNRSFDDVREDNLLFDREIDTAGRAPWQAEQYPRVLAWLQANERPLALLVEASRKSRNYTPLVNVLEYSSMNASLRIAGRMLKARAMLRLGNQDADGAWNDLAALRRLTELWVQRPTTVRGLTAFAVSNACVDPGMLQVLKHGNLDRAALTKYLREIASSPWPPSLANAFRLDDRCMYLAHVAAISKNPARELYQLDAIRLYIARMWPWTPDDSYVLWRDAVEGLDFGSTATKLLVWMFGPKVVDWDELCRIINRRHDAYSSALDLPTHAARTKAFRELSRREEEELDSYQSPYHFALLLVAPASLRQIIARRVYCELMHFDAEAASNCSIAHDRTRTSRGLLVCAFALAAYRAEYGNYPENLEMLHGHVIPELPLDPFSDKPFQYRHTKDGYVVYSIYLDEKDDGGMEFDWEKRKGDEVVRMGTAD